MAVPAPRSPSPTPPSSPLSSPRPFVTAPSSPAIPAAAATHSAASSVLHLSPPPSAAGVALVGDVNIEAAIQAVFNNTEAKNVKREKFEKIKQQLNLQDPLHKIFEAECNLGIAKFFPNSKHEDPKLLDNTLATLEQARAMIAKAENTLQPYLNNQLLRVWKKVSDEAQKRPIFEPKRAGIQAEIRALSDAISKEKPAELKDSSSSSVSATSPASPAHAPSATASSSSSSSAAGFSFGSLAAFSNPATSSTASPALTSSTSVGASSSASSASAFGAGAPLPSSSSSASSSHPAPAPTPAPTASASVVTPPPARTILNKSSVSNFLSLKDDWTPVFSYDNEKEINQAFQELSNGNIEEARQKFRIISESMKTDDPRDKINYALCIFVALFCSSSFAESDLKRDVDSAFEQLKQAEQSLPEQAVGLQRFLYRRMEILYKKMCSFLEDNNLPEAKIAQACLAIIQKLSSNSVLSLTSPSSTASHSLTTSKPPATPPSSTASSQVGPAPSAPAAAASANGASSTASSASSSSNPPPASGSMPPPAASTGTSSSTAAPSPAPAPQGSIPSASSPASPQVGPAQGAPAIAASAKGTSPSTSPASPSPAPTPASASPPAPHGGSAPGSSNGAPASSVASPSAAPNASGSKAGAPDVSQSPLPLNNSSPATLKDAKPSKKVSTGFFTTRTLTITTIGVLALGTVAVYYTRPSLFAPLRTRLIEWIQDLRKRFRI